MKSQSTYSSGTSLLKAQVQGLLGSSLQLSFAGLPEKKAYALWTSVSSELTAIDKVFNAGRADSEVYLINESKVDVETSDTIKDALNLNENYLILSKGYFDVHLGGENLDFGAFAKAYTLERIAALMKKGKVKDWFASFEGSLVSAHGHGPYEDCWTYTLNSPETDDEIKQWELRDESLALSGNGVLVNPLSGKEIDLSGTLCSVKSKDSFEAKVIGISVLLAPVGSRAEIISSFAPAEVEYFSL